jgi:tryptophanase
MDAPPEPFRIKVVERLKHTTREERVRLIEEAELNIFSIPSESIYIDLLTDSGTSAMSDHQWSRLMLGDEAYAGSRSFSSLERTIRTITGYQHVLPTHQGRAAEHLLYATVVSAGQFVPNTYHFDTTRAHIELQGGAAMNLVGAVAEDPDDMHPFKGNMDLEKLAAFLADKTRDRVPLCLMTVTNNAGGGQPVSMQNIREVREITRRHNIPLFFDACRFAENCWFIREREPGYAGKSVREIARELFSLGDGCTMSAKKDGLANIGGFIALNDSAWMQKLTQMLIVMEGFPTYGGLAGRDLEAIAQGLEEVQDEDYLAYRVGQVRYLGELLRSRGVPIMNPIGGHAIYLNAGRILPHIPQSQFPAQALVIELYRRYGIRSGEFGSLTFSTPEPETGKLRPPALEMVRLAIPRRVYTSAHLKYVADGIAELFACRNEIRGLCLTHEAPVLRHFTAKFAEIDRPPVAGGKE